MRLFRWVGGISVLAFALTARAADVPLALWKNATFPSGLPMGGTMGVSWGDYDADGYIDLFACFSGSLWRNNAGVSWEFGGNLSMLVPSTERRYGSSFGDYDNDGLPDIAMAPRVPAWGDDRFHLLNNLRTYPYFADVAADPAIVDVQPYGNAETLCWADVDGDADLDLFVPAYPSPGPGNFFLENRGARFVESSAAAGLEIPPGNARPEGAQFADVDFDGDPDLFANGTLYQNVSTLSTPRFIALEEAASGIGLASSIDEGAMMFDYDLDGDQDLVVAYAGTAHGVRIWENAGDGTFFAAEQTIVDEPFTGLDLGMSAEDWDGDGDVDLTTRAVFRQNRMIEDGVRHFTVQPTSIPSWQLLNATPAWGDWDLDGDLDCALGNWGYDGKLYQNTTYSPATPVAARRMVRVRVVRSSVHAPRGLETEYGATVEVRILGASDTYRRRKFVASSHGYLNQNEYALTFGLPPLPAALSPGDDLHFDLSVDFPGLPGNGLWRIDKNVNPVLGDIPLSTLANREIQVSRCGTVRLNGVNHLPRPLATPRLATTAGGLALPQNGGTVLEIVETPADGWIGLAFDTHGATSKLMLEEIVVDAQLAAAETCAQTAFNTALWDVTDPAQPALVNGGALLLQTSPRNRRSYLPVEIALDPGRAYRLVTRVSQYRKSAIVPALPAGAIKASGGLAYEDAGPCNGQKTARATIDPAATAIAVRIRPKPVQTALDPVGPSLRLAKGAGGDERLSWSDVGAPAYRVRRCDATAGPCVPVPHALSTGNTHRDGESIAIPSPPRESLWYLVDAINECEAGL